MKSATTLSKPQLLTLRRAISLVSIVLSCGLLACILIGVIPFRGRSINVYAAINLIFELVLLGKRAFWHCVTVGSFGIIYIVTSIKILINIISRLKNFKHWFSSQLDSYVSRTAAKSCVLMFNGCVTDFFF